MPKFRKLADILTENGGNKNAYVVLELLPTNRFGPDIILNDITHKLDDAFGGIDGEITHALLTSYNAICEFDDLARAHTFMGRIQTAIRNLDGVALEVKLYHGGHELDHITTEPKIASRH